MAPRYATTIPRLELCAAAECTKTALSIIYELENKPTKTYSYSDSIVVIGYLANCERRYTKYVARRVHMALKQTCIPDWCYVNTKENPADFSSRPTLPDVLMQSFWFTGPSDFKSDFKFVPYSNHSAVDTFPEERPLVASIATLVTSVTVPEVTPYCLSSLFSKVSHFNRLIKIVTLLLSWRSKVKFSIAPPTRESEIKCLIKVAQKEAFSPLLSALTHGKELPINNSLSRLAPILDPEGILRVGGRLARPIYHLITTTRCWYQTTLSLDP